MAEQVEIKRDSKGRLLPGHTANPNGRPKKDWTWAGLLVEEAEKIDDTDPEKTRKVKHAVVQAIVKKAAAGDVAAFKEIADRIDGKVPQGLEHTGEDGGPITIVTKVPEPDADD